MKFGITFILYLSLLMNSFSQQKIKEPPYINSAYFVQGDSMTVEIPKESGSLKSKGFGMYYFEYLLNGNSSSKTITKNDTLSFLVKPTSTQVDPKDNIVILKFDTENKKYRRFTTDVNSSEISKKYEVDFSVEKYSETCFIYKFPNPEPGEYILFFASQSYGYTFQVK